MKLLLPTVMVLLAIAGYCQTTRAGFASLSSTSDRLSMVRNSIEIPVWHEKSFWPVYEKFVADEREISARIYRSLDEFIVSGATGSAHTYLSHRAMDLELRKKYYQEIGANFNGLIALQFLQTETIMDMMETFSAFEESKWKNFRFHANAVPEGKIAEAKKNMLKAALGLSGSESEQFFEIYGRFENECYILLDGYEIYSLYAGEPADFTPALAKRLGYDLLQVLDRELKLKEKYYNEIDRTLGGTFATGFLAWEDYYSVVRKMHAWAEMRE